MQYSEVGGPKFEWILIGDITNVPYETYLEIVQYQDNPPSYEEYGWKLSDIYPIDPNTPDKERLYKVCSPDNYVTVFGAALVDKDGNICPTFNYQPAGLIVNGVAAVKNEPYNRYMLEDTMDRDFSKGEVANGGGLAVLNAYTGELVTGFEYDAIGVTTEGYTPVKKGDKWGLVRIADGEVVIDCILDNISNVYAGKVYVEYEGNKGVLALNTTLGLGIAINADTLS